MAAENCGLCTNTWWVWEPSSWWGSLGKSTSHSSTLKRYALKMTESEKRIHLETFFPPCTNSKSLDIRVALGISSLQITYSNGLHHGNMQNSSVPMWLNSISNTAVLELIGDWRELGMPSKELPPMVDTAGSWKGHHQSRSNEVTGTCKNGMSWWASLSHQQDSPLSEINFVLYWDPLSQSLADKPESEERDQHW